MALSANLTKPDYYKTTAQFRKVVEDGSACSNHGFIAFSDESLLDEVTNKSIGVQRPSGVHLWTNSSGSITCYLTSEPSSTDLKPDPFQPKGIKILFECDYSKPEGVDPIQPETAQKAYLKTKETARETNWANSTSASTCSIQ